VKVRDRIGTITDLLLGAVYADCRFEPAERRALRDLLCDLLVAVDLPVEIERRIASFAPAEFDLVSAARDFRRDPPMRPRRLLQLISELCAAKGEFDFDEDEYLHRLARALELEPAEYEDIVLDYEVLPVSDIGAALQDAESNG
jgi:uncharacterized tellurite resistance protein B-like protein